MRMRPAPPPIDAFDMPEIAKNLEESVASLSEMESVSISQSLPRKQDGPPLPYKLVTLTPNNHGGWTFTCFCQPRDPFEDDQRGKSSLHMLKRLQETMVFRIYDTIDSLNNEQSKHKPLDGYTWVLKSIQVPICEGRYWINEPQFSIVLEMVHRQTVFDNAMLTRKKSEVPSQPDDEEHSEEEEDDEAEETTQETEKLVDVEMGTRKSEKYKTNSDIKSRKESEDVDSTDEVVDNVAKLKLKLDEDFSLTAKHYRYSTRLVDIDEDSDTIES